MSNTYYVVKDQEGEIDHTSIALCRSAAVIEHVNAYLFTKELSARCVGTSQMLPRTEHTATEISDGWEELEKDGFTVACVKLVEVEAPHDGD